MKKTVKILSIVFAIVLALSLTGCDIEKHVENTLDKASSIIDHAMENQEEILDHSKQQQNDLLEHGMQMQDELLEHGMQMQQNILNGNLGSDGKEEKLDYDAIIDSFVPDALNTFELSVGDTHNPNAAVWLQGSRGAVYSSDEAVVTVTELGKVTAVGQGTAYVIIVGGGKMNACYRYDVVG